MNFTTRISMLAGVGAPLKGIAGVALSVLLVSVSASARAAVPPKLVFPPADAAGAVRNSGLMIELAWGNVGASVTDDAFELRNDQGELLELGSFSTAVSVDEATTFVVSPALSLAPNRSYTLSTSLAYDSETNRLRELDTPEVFAVFTTGETIDDTAPEITAIVADDEVTPEPGWYGPPCAWRLDVAAEDDLTPQAWIGFRLHADWVPDKNQVYYAIDDGLVVRVPGGQAAKPKGLELIPVDASGNAGESQVVDVPACPFEDNSEGPVTFEGNDVVEDSDADRTVDPASRCSIAPAAVGRNSSNHWCWTATVAFAVGALASRTTRKR